MTHYRRKGTRSSAANIAASHCESDTWLPYDPAAFVAMIDAFLDDETVSPAEQQASLEALMEALGERHPDELHIDLVMVQGNLGDLRIRRNEIP